MPIDEIANLLAAKADALIRRADHDLAALMDGGFVYVNASGRRFDKAGYVAAYCVSGQIRFRSQRARELELGVFPGFAVATLFVDDVFEMQGQLVEKSYRSLCVFRRDDERWLWAAGQTMAVG